MEKKGKLNDKSNDDEEEEICVKPDEIIKDAVTQEIKINEKPINADILETKRFLLRVLNY